jgi:hypothetical protein
MRTFRLLLAVFVGLSVGTPAAAQFKKLKDAMSKKEEPKAAESAPRTPGPAGGGTIVLTPEVVDRVLLGYKAAQAEREKAVKEDTPYGRHIRAKRAYAEAEPKCAAAQGTWSQRAIADEKLINRYTAKVDQAQAAQQKGDMAAYEARTYEALAIIDQSCAVKNPEQPAGFYDAQRAVDERANKANVQAAGFTDAEVALISERLYPLLTGSEPPGGASASEKSAVKAKEPELKAAYGIREAQEERVAKQAPTPAPAAAQAPTAPPVNQCMVNNVKAHEKEIQALGDRGSAAEDAGNTALMMAIADTIMRIQMAGCSK